jgi:DNA-binding NarL/FixJ family response regulator
MDPAIMNRVVSEFRTLHETAEGPSSRLTPREAEVLQSLVGGLSNQEIADRLVVSEKTVKSHLTSIYRKLDVRDRSQAIVTAVREGLADVRGGEADR